MTAFRLVSAALWPLALVSEGRALHSGRTQGPGMPRLRLPYRKLRDLVYTPAHWPGPLLADVYLPRTQAPLPGVLLVHGGGWHGGNRTHTELIAEKLARRGYVVVNATYRLAPAARYPAPLHDLGEALRWMRARADEFNLDPARVGAWGYSAGAHLAALLALAQPDQALRALVLGSAPTDLRKFRGGSLVPGFLGERWSKGSKLFREASPVAHVAPGGPPAFLYHGTADRLVPVDHATDFKAALDAAGVPNELYLTPGAGHIMANLLDYPAVQRGADFLDRWLR